MNKTILTILLILLTAAPVRAEVLEVATSVYCPLVCLPEKVPHDGVMHEILRRAFEGSEYEVQFNFMPYERAIEETLDGLHDAITFIGSAHAEEFVFVRNLDMINVVHFATRTGCDWEYDGRKSLQPIRFSIPAGFRTGNPDIDDYLTDYEEDATRIKVTACDSPTRAQQMNLECLMEDRIDAMLVGSLAFRYIARQMEMRDKLQLDPTPVAMFYNRIAFSPAHPKAEKLRDLVESRIREMRTTGELAEILDYYGLKP